MKKYLTNYKILNLFNTNVYLNWSTILFFLFIGLISYQNLIVLSFAFIFVIIHEFAHILMARKKSFTTGDIIMFPFGGAAIIHPNNNATNWDNILVSIAGPISNLLLAFVFCIPLFFIPDNLIYEILMTFVMINIFIGLFNLIPAYPMDGGRILKSILLIFLNKRLASKITSMVALMFGCCFIFIGFGYSMFILGVIGLIICLISGAQLSDPSIQI